MRIWHHYIIPSLPQQLLKAQHRDCCALRGKAWGKSRSSRMRWLWNYTIGAVEFYHLLVLEEMDRRGWKTSPNWRKSGYRGRKAPAIKPKWLIVPEDWPNSLIFKEHDQNYLARDLKELRVWFAKHKISEDDLTRISKWI